MGQAERLFKVQLPKTFSWARFERERGEGAFVMGVVFRAGMVWLSCAWMSEGR